jgi:hypothetical protein
MSERFERFKRVREDIWCDCNPTWTLNPQSMLEIGESIFDELPKDNPWTGV